MNLPAAFWDSSALIPLCVHQEQSAGSKALFARYGLTVWWTTPVEVLSGLTRLQRMRELKNPEYLRAKSEAERLADFYDVIVPSGAVAADACSMLERFPLSAADALQLAAALYACEAEPGGYVFISGDQRLADAARQTGFTVEFI